METILRPLVLYLALKGQIVSNIIAGAVASMDDSIDLSVGIDLVSIARIEGVLERWGERFLDRVFTRDEVAYCMVKPRPARSLAARFAAKEAFFKAVAARGARGVALKEVEVAVNAGGAPVLTVHGRAALALGGRKAALSISHESDYAVAVVMTTV
jgi:holo-[acyl-carrier protein] synthase